MAVTYIFSPSTIIASAEVNTNFTDVDYADIENDKKIQWRNSSNTLSAFLQQDSSDNLIFNNPDGHIVIQPPSGSYFYLQGTTPTQRIYNTGNTRYLEMYQDTNSRIRNVGGGDLVLDSASNIVRTLAGNTFRVHSPDDLGYAELEQDNTNTILRNNEGQIVLQTVNGNVYSNVGANGNKFIIGRMPRDNNGSATYVDSHIQRGWGYAVGDDGFAGVAVSVTFPQAFSSDNVTVLVSSIGLRLVSAGVPSDEGDFTTTTGFPGGFSNNATATGFSARIGNSNGALSSSSYYWGFSWIAIGPS